MLTLSLHIATVVYRISLELPSGLVKANESLEEAALRELEEETGYKGVVKV